MKDVNDLYKYQVNFEKEFVDGILKGKLYHDYLRFTCKSDAIAFSKRDGLIITPWTGSSYRQQNSQLIDLADFA